MPRLPFSACRLPGLRLSGLILALALWSPAQALTLPMNGWSATDASQKTWTDTNAACLVKEEALTQPDPGFTTLEAARAFSARLENTLRAQKLEGVIAQPVERAGRFTVLAAYLYSELGVQYHVTQLYLSDGGKLRTVTGSNANGEASECVVQMREFLRYLAN